MEPMTARDQVRMVYDVHVAGLEILSAGRDASRPETKEPDSAVYPGNIDREMSGDYAGGARVSEVAGRAFGRIHRISREEAVVGEQRLKPKS